MYLSRVQPGVGTAITDHLSSETYDFTLLDITEPSGPGKTVVADVREYDAIRPAFEGLDAVIHLALIREGAGFSADARAIGW